MQVKQEKALLKKGAKKVAAKVGGKAIAKVGAKALGKGLIEEDTICWYGCRTIICRTTIDGR